MLVWLYVKRDTEKQKTSILDDIDFELELIHRDQINVAYILKLLAQLKGTKTESAAAVQRKAIIDLLGGDIQLRSKRELIQKFIDENMPHIKDGDSIEDEFEKFWQDQKVLALGKLCEDEHLDNRPSILQARFIGDRIIAKMKEFVEVFVRGMMA